MGEEAGLESELLDVTGIDLDQLDGLPESVLRASLLRILSEPADLPDGYAGFQNAL